MCNGVAPFDEDEDLFGGTYRVLIEPENDEFPTSSQEIQLTDGAATTLQVIPNNHGAFSYDEFVDLFLHEDQGNMVSWRYPQNANITSYHYDQSHFEGYDATTNNYILKTSNDPQKVASPCFIEETITAVQEVAEMIPSSQNINVETYVESEAEIDFPLAFSIGAPESMAYFGYPEAPYAITRANTTNENSIGFAYAGLKTKFDWSPDACGPASTRSDVIENFGIRTTGHGELITNGNSEYNELASLLVKAIYSYGPGSGAYNLDSSIPAKDRGSVARVEHYEP